MSYNINCNEPFISTKLTEIGREKLAKGRLNFKFFSLGDSEINYEFESFNDIDKNLTAAILKAKEQQPEFRFFLTKNDLNENLTHKYPLNESNLQVLKLNVVNKADERGFFDGTINNWSIKTDSEYVKYFEIISTSKLNGTKYLDLNSSAVFNIGDYILIKVGNDNLSDPMSNNVDVPVPFLWYKIVENNNSGLGIKLDRKLPNYSGMTNDSIVYIYPKGEVYETFGSGELTPYWDNNTLTFTNDCDVTLYNVPVWNLNIVYSESMCGTPENYLDHKYYKSYNFLGQKEQYLKDIDSNQNEEDVLAFCVGDARKDKTIKSLSIIHYTNKTISNYYGDYFYISDEKQLKLHLPTIMYHRRYFSGGTANLIGMTFVSDSEKKYIDGTNILYYDLIEDENLISEHTTPKIVGRIFPQLKIITIFDDEINAVLSYKSNRNWTLPSLDVSLIAPTTGLGVLGINQTIYMTYLLECNDGLTTALPCQYYTKIKNTTSTQKDVQFKIENIGLLSYMRKIESPTYDGYGFYAHRFKVLYQIVDNDERPDPSKWKIYDFTSSAMGGGITTIDPSVLENQIPYVNDFVLNVTKNNIATIFDLSTVFELPINENQLNILYFGEERFFYGNIDTYIGASIFKTIFDLRINGAEFRYTTNPTKINNTITNLRVSEIGIYDEDEDLVIVGKLSKPIEIKPGITIMFELSLDF